jgi:hypothetical protein
MEQYKKDKIDNFLEITGNKLDMLYPYLTSAYQDIRMGSIEAGKYINERFGDDFYLKRANSEYEEYIRSVGGKSGGLHY